MSKGRERRGHRRDIDVTGQSEGRSVNRAPSTEKDIQGKYEIETGKKILADFGCIEFVFLAQRLELLSPFYK